MEGDSDKSITTQPVDHILRGRLLRLYRSNAGMSLREFARLAKVDHSIISRVERGSQHAPRRVLEAYQEILDLEVRGSEVLPASIHVDLTIEIGVYLDRWSMLRLVWSGQTGRYRYVPELIMDAADWKGWKDSYGFTDVFGRTVEKVETPTKDLPPSPYRDARPIVLAVPGSRSDAFAPYEEAWILRPPPLVQSFRFATRATDHVDNCRLKFFLHSYNRTMLWFGDTLIARPAARMTIVDLGPLGPNAWHTVEWGRLNSKDFGTPSHLYGVSPDRERLATSKGWIQVGANEWENEAGVRKPLDEI